MFRNLDVTKCNTQLGGAEGGALGEVCQGQAAVPTWTDAVGGGELHIDFHGSMSTLNPDE